MRVFVCGAVFVVGCSLPLDRTLDGNVDGGVDAVDDVAPLDTVDVSVDLPKVDTISSYSWKAGEWGDCSTDCGGGTQTREVVCERGDAVKVDDTLCDEVSKPSEQQDCNTHSCKITGENCESCPYGYTQQSGVCLDKFACNLQPKQVGRYFHQGAWHEGCAICNMGGPIKWEIETP